MCIELSQINSKTLNSEKKPHTLQKNKIAWLPFFIFISNILLINQWDWITGYAYANPLQQQDGTIRTQFT